MFHLVHLTGETEQNNMGQNFPLCASFIKNFNIAKNLIKQPGVSPMSEIIVQRRCDGDAGNRLMMKFHA